MDCRKSVRDLTEQERRDFVTAVRKLKQNGEYDAFVKTHFEAAYEQDQSGNWTSKGLPNDAHGGPAFLPWHRKYLREFEKKLQEQVPGVTLPYWDWAEDARQAGQNGGPGEELSVFKGDPSDPTDGLLGGNGTLSDGPIEGGFNTSPPYDWNLQYDVARGGPVLDEYDDSDDRRLERNLGSAARLPRPRTVEAALSIDEFYEEPVDWGNGSFRDVLEGFSTPPTDAFPDIDGDGQPDPIDSPRGLHNYVHGWVGGDMLPMTSPNDPIFFLHHCYVDKLWADWQARHPEAEQFPPNSSSAPDGHRLGTQMPPWNIDPGTTIDYRSMGYVYDTSLPTVELTRPEGTPTTLQFNDVPEGRETSRAVVFDVAGCETTVTLQVENVTGSFSVKPGMGTRRHTTATDTNRTEAKVWLTYTGGAAGTNASGTATVYCPDTDERWTVQLSANAIAEPTVGVAMVLDESGSMASPSGDGSRTRIQMLRDAGEVFLDLLPTDNSLGIATFHSDASAPFPTQTIGGRGTTARSDARSTIRNLSPTETDPATDAGYTSIGDGVVQGRDLLSATSGVDERAMVVLTDGHENRPEYIADLEPSGTDEKVFAVGLGTPSQIRPAALQQLTNASGPNEGYVHVSGSLSIDDRFLLDKYFLQILAGVTNRDIVVDPQGRLRPESNTSPGSVRFPFEVSGADLDLDVVLLSPSGSVFSLMLETPDGTVIEAGDVTGADEQYVDGERVDAFRLPLPYNTGEQRARAGEWTARIEIDEEALDPYLRRLEETDIEEYERTIASGVPYNLLVNARSNLSFDTSVRQTSFEPGTSIRLTASLEESGLPLSDPTITADHTRPDGTRGTVRLSQASSGMFEASIDDADAGLHSFRVRAQGSTLDGDSFVRESLTTGSLWSGGDDPLPNRGTHSTGDRADDRMSEFLFCLLRDEALEEYFDEHGIDREIVRECLERATSEDE